jgi:hypothetical protein
MRWSPVKPKKRRIAIAGNVKLELKHNAGKL